MREESLPGMPFPWPSSTLLKQAGAEEQATALSAWSGDGAVPLLAKSFEENGAALLIGRIVPGVALRPLDDPAGKRIARCLKRLGHIRASSVRGSLPSGLERLNALISANACHLHALSPSLRRHQDGIIALADALVLSCINESIILQALLMDFSFGPFERSRVLIPL